MSVNQVVVKARVGDCWFSAVAASPAEAYKMASEIIDEHCKSINVLKQFKDKDKSEIMRTILSIFDGHLIGHEGHYMQIQGIKEEEKK